MRRSPIRLNAAARRIACHVMVESLSRRGVEVIALCVDDHHYHILARFPKPTEFGLVHRVGNISSGSVIGATPENVQGRGPSSVGLNAPTRKDGNDILAVIRHLVGVAKKESALALSKAGHCEKGAGGIWAKRCRALSVKDRAHQLNVYQYIVEHAQRGAAVWTFRDRPQ